MGAPGSEGSSPSGQGSGRGSVGTQYEQVPKGPGDTVSTICDTFKGPQSFFNFI